jgi:hypothetical protein
MTTTFPTGSVSVSFQRFGASGSGTSGAASIALDDAKNLQVYGQEKSSFKANEIAYLKLHCEPGYELHCSAGTIIKGASGIVYPYSQDLVFPLSKSESLQQLPDGMVYWQWIGKDGGTPLFLGRAVNLPSVKVGTLRCEYQSIGDRLKLVATSSDIGIHETMNVVVVVSRNGVTLTSMTVTYESGIVVTVPVELMVSDFCSDDLIDDVEVFLDGIFIGKTNTEGKISLGMLIPGSQHQLKMIRAGYTDSDIDVLHNDSFTVPLE